MAKNYFAFKATADGIAHELRTKVIIMHPSILTGTNLKNKKVLEIEAVWDTGASASVITQKYIDALGLKPTGMAKTLTAGGAKDCPTYIVDIGLPNKLIIPNLSVTGNDELVSCDMLIGMDVISMGDFAISNAKGKTHFSYCIPPHDNPICLYEKSLKVNKR